MSLYVIQCRRGFCQVVDTQLSDDVETASNSSGGTEYVLPDEVRALLNDDT